MAILRRNQPFFFFFSFLVMKRISYLDLIEGFFSSEEFAAFKEQYQQALQKSIKLLSKDQAATLAALRAEGRKLSPPAFSWEGKKYDELLFVEKSGKSSLGSHPFHQAGKFYVQEMAAGLPAQILKKQKNAKVVLDLCAAPGGKTIQLADGGAEVVIANELNPQRRKALEANLERCGIWNTIVTGYDGRELGNLLFEQCDQVLLDAPCSGEGMQYKKDCQIRWRNPQQVKKLTQLQRSLFASGFQALRVGGELLYSTCTTNTLENEENIAYFLKAFAGKVKLLKVKIAEKSPGLSPGFWSQRAGEAFDPEFVGRFWPHLHHTGGFFLALFQKVDSCEPEPSKKSNKALPSSLFRPINKASLGEEFALLPDEMTFLASKHSIWATRPEVLPFLEHLYLHQVGLPIAKILPDGRFKPLAANLQKIL